MGIKQLDEWAKEFTFKQNVCCLQKKNTCKKILSKMLVVWNCEKI